MTAISAAAAKALLTGPEEYAFLDVREHGQYGEGHPFFAVNAPFSILETRAPVLVPRKATRCILLDDGDGVAGRAARVLNGLGYADVLILEGGAPGWQAAGFTLFKGVNVPSKTFGEMVEHEWETPSITPQDLKRWQETDQPFLLLDGRSPAEFARMSLPGARSCPNAELAYRLPRLLAGPETPVVINCAGRTRSIIGAETLRRAGIANPVYALRNGTQGWRLAGFELDHGKAPATLPEITGDALEAARRSAEALARRWALPRVGPAECAQWLERQDRTTFLFDVRTREEYDRAHWPGARHAAGGQLVQATDEYLAVRGARIVLSDDAGLRGATTAIWLRGMGHEVHLLDADASAGTAAGPEPAPVMSCGPGFALADLPDLRARGARLLDASRGLDYRAGHIEGAEWITRARADALAGVSSPLLVVGRDRSVLACLVAELAVLGAADVRASHSGPDDWAAAGLSVIRTPDSPREAECIDHLFFVHDRHDGNLDAARQYLEWELGLLDQLDAQERSVLSPLEPAPPDGPA